MTVFSDLSTPELIEYANDQANLSALEVALLDRLQGYMEEVDVLVAHLDNYRAEDALLAGEVGPDGDT